ncbi:hypothetical protein L195_g022376, partial [Trifolium pratense]
SVNHILPHVYNPQTMHSVGIGGAGLWHYSPESDFIVWTGGAVTTASFISVASESPARSRISRYS